MNEIILRGKINEKGELLIYGLRDLQKFNSEIKGEKVLISIKKLPKDKTQRQIAYIEAKIIPEFQRAFREQGERYTLDQIAEKILQLSSVSQYGKKEILDMNRIELSDFIDDLKLIAAEHFGFFIDDSVII